MTIHSKNLTAIKTLFKKAIARQESEEELDAVFLVCGEEGSGKSNTILILSQIWEEETGKQIDIGKIARNIREVLYELAESKKSFIALDEGAELKSTNLWDILVKRIEEAFVVSRANANISLISFPNPFKLNSYFRDDRSRGIFFCYERKYIYYFNRDSFRDIRFKVMKEGNVKSINDFCKKYKRYATIIEYNVPKYEGHLAKEYIQRKRDNINNILNNIRNELKQEEKTYSYNKAVKLLGINTSSLTNYILLSNVTPQWNATHTKMKLSEADIKTIKQYIENTRNEKNTIPPHTIYSSKNPEADKNSEAL